MGIKGRIHSVETFGAVDGPGIRYVVFMQGCQLRCMYCHNPDSWDMRGGREISSRALAEDIKQYYHFIKNGGVTVSGGEPMLQGEFVLDLLERCRKIPLHTAVDTSGYGVESIVKKVADNCDLILLDIKAPNDELFRKLTGKPLRPTLDLLDYCERIGREVWIRHVLLPGITMTDDGLHALAKLISRYSCVKKTELLPFHKIGEYKWKELKLPYKLSDTMPPTRTELEHAASILRIKGLKVECK